MKIKIISLICLLCFSLSACVKENIINIDTFLDYYNENAENLIAKEQFTAFISSDEIAYCMYIDSLLLTVTCENNSSRIMQVSLSGDNTSCTNLKSMSEHMIKAVAGYDINKASEITNALEIDKYCANNSFYKSYIFEKDLTFGFVSTDIGNRFYINYNELNSITPTEIPEFQENYTLAKTQE